jgi:YHS domain-containing protein
MNIFADTSKTALDPVCGMKVNPEKTDLVFEWQRNNYYFCAEACRESFKNDPQKYVAEKTKARKGWWGRYMKRLNKATSGSPPKCCG